QPCDFFLEHRLILPKIRPRGYSQFMANTDEDLVVLVDERDWKIGTMPKIQAHKQNKLHRALSVLIFNSKGEMLLHKRAANKYHSGSLWTNACCSHPRPEEPALEAAQRRLLED